jgi:hypothetical protein
MSTDSPDARGPGSPTGILDDFFSLYLECELALIPPGHTVVNASPRREAPELLYDGTFALWMFVTAGRCAISVQGRLLKTVSGLAHTLGVERLRDATAVQHLVSATAQALGVRQGVSSSSGPVLYCTDEALRVCRDHPCFPVAPENMAVVLDTHLYDSSLDASVREGTCYVAYDGDRPVAIAGTYPVPHMAQKVADVAVPGTLGPWRGRGFGRTVVSHTTEAVLESGRVPFYITSDTNTASIHTARSVGYHDYGWQFRIKLPAEP